MKSKYDVIMVGGGPAGTALAVHLAREGREILLLERAEFPRDKPCGEFFSPPVRGMLSRLGVYESVLAAGTRRIEGARIYCDNGKSFAGAFTAASSRWAREGGFSIPRLVLDKLLWEHAGRQGVDARSGMGVRSVLRDYNGAINGVHTDAGDFYAPLVVGADGGHSRIARAMNVVCPIGRLQKIALVAHYQLLAEKEDTLVSVEMHLGRTNRVCGWGPGPNHTANLTLVVEPGAAREIAAFGAAGFLEKTLECDFPSLAHRLHGATQLRVTTRGTFGHTTTSPIADGALLVGDAAAFIDPFTGEGVYFALRSAELAAETITKALQTGNTSMRGLRGYAKARQYELLPKYAVCQLVERAVHTPRLMRRVAPRFARHPWASDRLLGVTGDMVSPYQLLSPRWLLTATA